VIIRHFDIVSITGNEPEANAPLVVDGDRMLSFSVSPELVESISRRNPKVIQARCQVDVLELSPRSPQYLWRQLLGPTGLEQFLRVPVCEALDHASSVIHHVTVVNPPPPAASPNGGHHPQMLSGFMNLPIAVGWVAHFMIGTVLALVYAIVFVGFLPGPPVARGALYGLAPFLLAQIMVMPMMGAGFFSSGMGDKAMAAVMGSLIGHLLYGAIVGGIYGRQESSITVTPQKAR